MSETVSVDSTVERIEALLDGFADPEARARAEELVRALMELYGAGLTRVMEAASGFDGLAARLGEDKLTGSLLLIHGLHPLDAEARIRRAVGRIAGRMDSLVTLEGVADGIARVRLEKSGSPGLAAAVERAAREAAPEIERVEWTGPGLHLASGALVQIASAENL